MTITIHQPEHLPWCGLLDKIRKSDLFVILDTVQFEKNYFHNRNKTCGELVTVPVKKHPLATKIKDIQIDYSSDWVRKYLGTIKRLHSKDKDFARHYEWLDKTLNKRYEKLADLNIEIIKYFLYQFNINVPIVIASELDLSEMSGGNDKVKQICEYFKATKYLSGMGGKNYLTDIGIPIVYNDYQGYKSSALDLLLCGTSQF